MANHDQPDFRIHARRGCHHPCLRALARARRFLARYHRQNPPLYRSGRLLSTHAQAARRAHEARFDGVELFANYQALIEQFWTPWWNARDDEWGGSFENRMRFSRRIVERIRELVGDDFIIGLAVSIDPDVEVTLSIEAMQEILAWHEDP